MKGQMLDCPTETSSDIIQVDIACAIGVSRQTVNQILHRLEDKGLIAMSKNRITFLRPADLLHLVEM